MPTQADHLTVPRASRAAGWLDTHVRAIMRAGVISVPSDASVRQVQRALVAHRVHAVLVVDARSGEPVGWASARSILRLMFDDAALTPAAAAVTDPVECIAPGATAEEALSRMLQTGSARLLVRRHPDSPPEGVLSETDLVELATPR